MPVIESWDKIKSINIDFPFAQKNDFRLDGEITTSFKTLKEQIDRAVELGFNTIGFDTNVPINIKNGELQPYITKNDYPNYAEGNRDKSFSEEVWRGVEYAESLGLKTSIDLHIRNTLNDEAINLSNITSTFEITTLFNSVRIFETEIAKKAQIYGVDSIRIGSFNNSFDAQAYKNNWANVVDSIRDVYKGSLSYQSNVENKNSVIWDLVDIVKVDFTPKWLLESSFTKEEIARLYLTPYISGNQKISSESAYDSIFSLIKKFPDKKIELQVRFDPGQSAGHEFADAWSYVFAYDPLKENAKDQANLVPYSKEWIDTNLNDQKIAGFLEFFGNYLDKNISAIQFWQYMPWAEANWLRDPQTLNAKAWQSVVRSMGALNWNPEAEKMIGTYLTKDWGFSTLHFGSVSDDLLSGSSAADKFFGSSGNDKMDGGAGVDTVAYSGSISNYTLTKGASAYTLTDKTGVEGTDSLTNVDKLTFSNVTLPTSIDLFFATKGTAVAARGAVDSASAIATQMSVVYLGRPADKTLLVDLKTALGNEQPSAAVLNLIAAKAIQDGAFASSNSSKDIVVNTFNNIMGFLPSAYEQTEWAKYIDNGTLTKANAPWIIFQSYLGANNVPDVYKLPTQARFVAAQTFSDYAFLDTQQAGLASLNSIYANAARKWLAPVDSVSHAASKMQTMIADVESVTLTGVAPVDSFIG